LTSIKGFTTTLLAEDVSWEPEEQRDFVQTIQQEANRLQKLIDYLLDLSRLESGMLPITLESHNLQAIMEDASPQFQTLTSGQSFTIRVPANLPPVYLDKKHIAQVLVNLVRNAATYSPKGTEINIDAHLRKGVVQVNVIDGGPGIPPAEHKSVFRAFQRGVGAENGSVQGAGLGLAICKGLVETHGGRIWIKKNLFQGQPFPLPFPSCLGTPRRTQLKWSNKVWGIY
jgi:two-component system sensor histidine kinase KdpD